jgi:hypothetical protein
MRRVYHDVLCGRVISEEMPKTNRGSHIPMGQISWGIVILRLLSAGSAHAHRALKGIIDPPLEACTQGAHQ